MFRITFMTDDKRLPKALKGLVGISLGAPEVVPVVNAKATRNGVKAAPIDPLTFFKSFPTDFRTPDIVAALQAQGRSSNGYAIVQLTRPAIKAKVIKRVKNGFYKKL